MEYVKLDAVLGIIDKKVHGRRVRAQVAQGTSHECDAYEYNYVADELANLVEYIQYKAHGSPPVQDGEFQPFWIESSEYKAIDLDMRELE